MTVRQIQHKIFHLLRPLLNIPELKRVNNKGRELTDEQYLTKEYNYLFFDPTTNKYDYDN